MLISLVQKPDRLPLEHQIDVPDPSAPQEFGGVECVPSEYSMVIPSKDWVTT